MYRLFSRVKFLTDWSIIFYEIQTQLQYLSGFLLVVVVRLISSV